MDTIIVTKEEQKIVRSMERLAKKWPDSLSLFSWSGVLIVVKEGHDIAQITGIENDGGDPGPEEVRQLGFEIKYE